jgi:hypothetical protein
MAHLLAYQRIPEEATDEEIVEVVHKMWAG